MAFASERERRLMVDLIMGTTTSPGPLERYVPHTAWPRQRALLDLNCLEAFYGGAAAGGKSEALLMAALQYVNVPGYAALILRRDTRRLTLAGGLIPRSQQWLAGKGPTWNGSERRWTFPTAGAPATLSFGYLQDASDKYRYGSSEYQYIAFDELTEFPEDDYLFLFSRLRRTVDLNVPLRMRSASNPGNVGHAWVKRRFIGEASSQAQDSVQWNQGIAYVPARICDNPAVHEAEYRGTLSHLPPVERERLMNGNWEVQSTGLIGRNWLRYYRIEGNALCLLPQGGIVTPAHQGTVAQIDVRGCRRFVTVDPAGTSQERAQEGRGRPRSWSVAQVWDQSLGSGVCHLLLREVVREQVGFDGLCRMLRDLQRRWRPSQVLIENEKLGQAAVDVLRREMPIATIGTQGRDKVARAAPLIVKWERGEIWLPEQAAWLAAFETELLAWTGHPQETADQIDAAAYAALHVQDRSGPLTMERVFTA
jgi:phage terminase large subunit-like protein